MDADLISPCAPTEQSGSASASLDSFCRICLLRKSPLLPLASEYNGTMIPEMLWKVSGTLLNVLEQLPRVICERCLTKLDLAFSVAQEFRKQEELLRSFCWKGALIEQLDAHQQTEEARKEPYSEEVVRKLTLGVKQAAEPAAPEVKVDVSDGEEDPVVITKKEVKIVGPQCETTSSVVGSEDEARDMIVEQLDDVIVHEEFTQSEFFDLIEEDNSVAAESEGEAKEDRAVVVVKEESKDDEMSTKEDYDDGTGELPLLTPKTEEEEWIDELEDNRSTGTVEAEAETEPDAEETTEVDFTQHDAEDDTDADPIWVGDNECDEEDENEDEDEDKDEIESDGKSSTKDTKPTKAQKTTQKGKRSLKSVPNADGHFDCKECGRTFPVRKTFLNHLKRHENVSQGSFRCDICQKVFGTKDRLARHVLIHYRDLTCQECGKKCKNSYEARAHRSLHLKGKQRCNHCDFVYSTKEELLEHRNSDVCLASLYSNKTTQLKDKNCPFEGCSYTAETYGAMYVHKRAKHKPQFECDYCGKKFAFANQLREHETVHTGEKPYTCELCSKSFRRMFSYKEHMANHEGESKYKCKQCSKSFARPRYLVAHELTHSEERKFECSICSTRYKTNGELTKHVRAKHESLEYGNGNDLIEEDYDYFEDEIYL